MTSRVNGMGSRSSSGAQLAYSSSPPATAVHAHAHTLPSSASVPSNLPNTLSLPTRSSPQLPSSSSPPVLSPLPRGSPVSTSPHGDFSLKLANGPSPSHSHGHHHLASSSPAHHASPNHDHDHDTHDETTLDVNEPLLEGEDGMEEERQAKAAPVNTGNQSAKNLSFLCFDLTGYSQPVLFAMLSFGVMFFFLANGFLEEYLFKSLSDFHYGWYMTAFELLCFAGFAVLERYAKGESSGIENGGVLAHRAAIKHHLLVAFCMSASRGLTNQSLEYLNYPTQVIFKSMKLITVMIGSLFILKSKFTVLEYVSAIALVMSAILFSLGDSTAAPMINGSVGIIIVLLSLVADALHSNTQEQLLKQHQASILEAMLYTNIFASVMCWFWVMVSGELWPAMTYCNAFPIAYVLFVVRAAVIYLGVLCFVLMINAFGVVHATAITTVRKILTIIISFILFPKPITSRHVWGFIIFSAGISLSIWDKKREVAKKKAMQLQEREKEIQQMATLADRQSQRHQKHVSLQMVNMSRATSKS